MFIELFSEFQDKLTCNAWVATAIVGAGAIGGLATAYSANQASQAQQGAANTAAGINQQQLGYTQAVNAQNQTNLAPFRTVGQTSIDQINSNPNYALPATAPTFAPFAAPDVVNDTNAPGYGFTLQQGLKATQNSAAARGLGSSGAALKGAATFATGLANSTYGDVFNRDLSGYTTNRDTSLASFGAQQTSTQNAFSRLSALVNTGEAAAAGAATAGNVSSAIGTTGANNIGSNVIAGGNAAAAGYNATGAAVNNTANNLAGYAIAKGLYGNPAPNNQTSNYANSGNTLQQSGV